MSTSSYVCFSEQNRTNILPHLSRILLKASRNPAQKICFEIRGHTETLYAFRHRLSRQKECDHGIGRAPMKVFRLARDACFPGYRMLQLYVTNAATGVQPSSIFGAVFVTGFHVRQLVVQSLERLYLTTVVTLETNLVPTTLRLSVD